MGNSWPPADGKGVQKAPYLAPNDKHQPAQTEGGHETVGHKNAQEPIAPESMPVEKDHG